MKCLSVRQPWASLIVRGIKDVENRTWSTTYRGPLLIHASGRLDRDADVSAWITDEELAALPLGGIVGMVTLEDCVSTSDSPWFEGPVGWVLRDAQLLAFRSLRGQLSLFDVEISPEQSALRARFARHLFPLFRT